MGKALEQETKYVDTDVPGGRRLESASINGMHKIRVIIETENHDRELIGPSAKVSIGYTCFEKILKIKT